MSLITLTMALLCLCTKWLVQEKRTMNHVGTLKEQTHTQCVERPVLALWWHLFQKGVCRSLSCSDTGAACRTRPAEPDTRLDPGSSAGSHQLQTLWELAHRQVFTRFSHRFSFIPLWEWTWNRVFPGEQFCLSRVVMERYNGYLSGIQTGPHTHTHTTSVEEEMGSTQTTQTLFSTLFP